MVRPPALPHSQHWHSPGQLTLFSKQQGVGPVLFSGLQGRLTYIYITRASSAVLHAEQGCSWGDSDCCLSLVTSGPAIPPATGRAGKGVGLLPQALATAWQEGEQASSPTLVPPGPSSSHQPLGQLCHTAQEKCRTCCYPECGCWCRASSHTLALWLVVGGGDGGTRGTLSSWSSVVTGATEIRNTGTYMALGSYPGLGITRWSQGASRSRISASSLPSPL